MTQFSLVYYLFPSDYNSLHKIYGGLTRHLFLDAFILWFYWLQVVFLFLMMLLSFLKDIVYGLEI